MAARATARRPEEQVPPRNPANSSTWKVEHLVFFLWVFNGCVIGHVLNILRQSHACTCLAPAFDPSFVDQRGGNDDGTH